MNPDKGDQRNKVDEKNYWEQRFDQELSAEWKKEIVEGATTILDNYELLFGEQIIDGEKKVVPMYFDPISYSNTHKKLYELNNIERNFIVNFFLAALRFNPDANALHTTYEVDAPTSDDPNLSVNWEGTANVFVYELEEEFKERDMYLHQIRYPDKTLDSRQKIDYFVAPGDYTLS